LNFISSIGKILEIFSNLAKIAQRAKNAKVHFKPSLAAFRTNKIFGKLDVLSDDWTAV